MQKALVQGSSSNFVSIPICSCQGAWFIQCLQTPKTPCFGIRVLSSGDHGTVVPPVPIPNTEVKRCCADDSMAIGHVKVGRCQIITPHISKEMWGVFLCDEKISAKMRAENYDRLRDCADSLLRQTSGIQVLAA
jgi:hypothetical protein